MLSVRPSEQSNELLVTTTVEGYLTTSQLTIKL